MLWLPPVTGPSACGVSEQRQWPDRLRTTTDGQSPSSAHVSNAWHFTSTHNFHGVMLDYRKWNSTSLCEIWGYHSTVDNGSHLLGCYVSGVTVPDASDHHDTFMLRVKDKALWPFRTLGTVTANGTALHHRRPKSSTLHYFALLSHTVHSAYGIKRCDEVESRRADQISTDAKYFMSHKCFQLRVWY